MKKGVSTDLSSVTSSSAAPEPERTIFVAYPYLHYASPDYRKVFTAVESAFQVKFLFADQRIVNTHILDKIKGMIVATRFGIYDITTWNANVTLEYGLAFGMGKLAFIAFDPRHTEAKDAPADLRGYDRLQYTSFDDLEQKLGSLISQQLPLPPKKKNEDPIAQFQRQVLDILSDGSSLTITELADRINHPVAFTQFIVRPMVGVRLNQDGKARGARYSKLTLPRGRPPALGLRGGGTRKR